jgi:hypothetical protein
MVEDANKGNRCKSGPDRIGGRATMPDTDAALMTAFLHRANPMDARNVSDVATPSNGRNMWFGDHSCGRKS